MPFDANIAATEFRGKLPMQSFNQLRGAIAERCNASGTSIPAGLAADKSKFDLAGTFFADFQSTMSTLIPKFVNHTDNGGNWDGQSTIPNWTEATMLTAIGDAARLPAPSSIKAAAWCFQQYEMLNMIKWVHNNNLVGSFPTPYMWWPGYNKVQTVEGNWAAARSAFLAKPWEYSDGFTDIHLMQRTANGIQGRSGFFNVTRPHSLQFSLDIYYYSKGGSATWFSFDVLDVENVFHNVYSDGEGGDRSNINPIPTSAYDNQVTAWVSDPGEIGNISLGVNERAAILKFDGANGFTFKNW